jgi:hypothetical protein
MGQEMLAAPSSCEGEQVVVEADGASELRPY